VPEAEVEAIRDWLVLVNSHRYYSANPSGRFQKDIETVKGSGGHFPSDDPLSNIKETRGGATTITTSHIMRGSRSRSVKAVRTTLPPPSLHDSLPERESDWERTLTRELGPESLARHRAFPRSILGPLMRRSTSLG
jgi:hypothetical protein